MKRKSPVAVTQEEVSAALARFIGKGGVIQKLPAQNFRASGTVGGDKYQAYETLSDVPVLTGTAERVA